MASAKRKERTLKELYTVTQMITQPEITPVLRGSYRMQGPVDESNYDIQSNTVLSRGEEGLGRHSKSRKVLMRAESGTCSVCSAPCSSCLHVNRALMGLKTDEFSDETCQGNAGSQYSVNDAVPVKSNACDSGQCTASETSNLISVNSNYDIISCVTRGSDADKLTSYNNENIVRKNVLYSSASAELSSHKIDLIEIPFSKDRSEDVSSPKVLSTCSYPSSGKALSCNLNVQDLEEDSGSHLAIELREYSKEHLNSSLTKEPASHKLCGQRSASDTCEGTDDGSLIGGNSAASDKVYLNLEAETETGSGELPTEAVNSSVQIEEIEKVKESCGLPDVQETALQSQPVDDSDESDILEHDVKVCDICGDAGREDLLAICSRCSDGAEHTYCMREMMDKVPEGDWLCEECKFDDEIKNLKQDKVVTVDGNDKNQSSGLGSALDTNIYVKLDRKNSDVQGSNTNKDMLSTKVSCKRHAENIEVASAAKRLALEPTVGSPKASSPSRVAALARDMSLRNLDKGKMKPTHQLSSCTWSINDTSEATLSPTGPRLRTPQGTLSKSNSFNSTYAKPKVELVDDDHQKQKSAREPASLDMKEGAIRFIGKSSSFKSVNPGRLNPSESKVKMLSPKSSRGQDLKGIKQAKEWNLLERNNSFKSERPTVSMLKGDKKLASYGEGYSLPSVSNNRELKCVQSDSKLSMLSKPTSHGARRSSELPVHLAGSGEIKKQSCSPIVAGASLTNGISSSVEQKPNQTSLMDALSSSTYTAERPLCNGNEGLPDVLPRESTNLGERIGESSVNRSRPGISMGGRSVPCQKCNEIGHSAQFCTVSPQSLAVDASAARSSKEVMNKGNKLKAAIEAAMLKKPVIYRKHKMPDQSDELSVSSTNLNCELHSQDQLSTSLNTRNMFSADEVHEGPAVLRNSTADSCRQTTVNKMKQLSPLPSEAATLKTGDISPIVPSDGKPVIRDFPSHVAAAMSLLSKISAIPEHEYIWKGGFEVHKSGKLPELRDGIQAHLSTCASPKVLEMVNKFPPKILLNEVPRSSTWPVQFQETGVKEDNIALYFFAKSPESYEKSYKTLLETMMKNDLALKGNFDGAQLLILPSNHLPEKSQRWNMLYFLWGVFRGKMNCLQNVSGSPKKYFIPRDIPTSITSSPENVYSLGPLDGDLPTCFKACNVALVSECPASMETPCLLSETINGDCDSKASSLDPKGQCLQADEGGQDCRPDATSISRIQRTRGLSSQETRCTSSPLEANVDQECKLDIKLTPSVQAARTISGSKKSEKILMSPDIPPGVQCISSHSFEIPDRVNSNTDQVTLERTLKEEEGSVDTKPVLERDTMMRDQTMEQLHNWQVNHKKRPHEDPTWTVSQASAGTSQTSWNDTNIVLLDRGCASKKQKTGFTELYSSRNTSYSRESFVSGISDVGTISPMEKERGEEACNGREIVNNTGTAERFFFPVDPHPVKVFSPGENFTHCKVFSSEDDDRLPDGAPNLELALGAEMKPMKQGIRPFLGGKVDLKDGQGQPHENAATKGEENDVSACLSLSLSFPFAEEERSVKPVSKVEQLLPDRRHVNTSLLLFDSLSDK